MFKPQFLSIFRELVRFATCADYMSNYLLKDFNNLPPGHVERRDCYPMHCWRVTSFFVSLHDVLHMRLSAGLAYLSLEGYRQLNLGLKLQTNRPILTPIFRTTRLQQRDHSFDTLSVFLQLQSWLCLGIFCKRTIFYVRHMRLHIMMSLTIVRMKVWTVTVTSPQLVHTNNCDPLLVHWPHNFHAHFTSHHE
jgi:hypothetical protein